MITPEINVRTGATLVVESDGSSTIRLSSALTQQWQRLAAAKAQAEVESDCEPSGFSLVVGVLSFLLPDVDVRFDGAVDLSPQVLAQELPSDRFQAGSQ